MGRAGPHVSIGDVLERLREEFPDVTVSKIRFLESQGLIAPERTPSGYRKFYDDDIDRLRSILRLQKDQFLPLKVIKERLDAASAATDGGAGPSGGADRRAAVENLFAGARASEVPDLAGAPDAGPEGGLSLTRAELARAAELDDAELATLEEFGIVVPALSTGDRVLFDEDSLAAARAAAGFLRHGVEARHLRMYQAAAEREASLFAQLVLAYRRRRDPEARAQEAATLAELADHGRRLRAALLRRALRG